MKKQQRILLITGIAICVIALGCLFYPAICTFVNQAYNDSKILSYSNNVDSLSDEEKEEYMSAAKSYNENIANGIYDITVDYDDILDFNEDGILGIIEIPKINVNLPIYHGTDEDVLAKGAGHLETSSLPVGGESTHSVISAHTAYPNRIYFDNLTKLEVGDVFYVTVLNRTLTYEVCDINIVEPEDTSKIQIVAGKDYVSLMTCYPYAVNSHRLIVTGERVADSDNTYSAAQKISNSRNITLVAVSASIVVIILILLIFIRKNRNRNRIKQNKQEE